MSATDPTPPDEHEKEDATPVDDAPSDAPTEKSAELTPEQQLEAYEKSLKEDDWGHQPC